MNQVLKRACILLAVTTVCVYGQEPGKTTVNEGATKIVEKKEPRYRKVENNFGKRRFLTFKEDKSAKEWGLMNSTGLVILEPAYQYINIDMMNKYGIADSEINNVRSIIDSTGQVLLTGLDDAMNFFEDRAAIKRNGKWGYIDTKAQLVIDCQYETFDHFDEGIAVLSKLNPETQKICYGVIDRSGKPTIEFKYAFIDGFLENRGCFEDFATGKWGIMDTTGKVISPTTYDSLTLLGGAYFIAANAGKVGLVDKNAKVVVPMKYSECDFHGSDWTVARVVLNGKVGLIDIKTGIQIGQFYDDIGYFYSGLAKVTLNKKKGFMNKAGKVVIPIIYDQADSFFDAGEANVTTVTLNGKDIVIDKTGKKVKDADPLDDE